MINELFERELQNTSINDVSLADYVKENYLPISALDKIRAEIEQIADEEQKYDEKWAIGLEYAVKIIDKHIEGAKNDRE